MDENQLLGNFYFRRTEDGNLTGEFTNNAIPDVITESADRNPNPDSVVIPDNLVGNEFLGVYNSSWRQGNEVFRLTLEITRPLNSKFELFWRNENHDAEYRGQGFMDGDKLIGYYIQI